MALLGFEVLERRGFADGAEYGAAGTYEYLRCRAHYAVDPAAPGQAPITDIQHAPRGADGLVHFAGDVQILKPVEPLRGNRRVFFDWGNRGNKRCLQYFNDAKHSNDPSAADHAGNGFLLRRGYAVVWGAWQGDLLPGNGRVLLDLPVAMQDGRPVQGQARLEYLGQEGVDTFPLSGWVSTRSHPTVSLDTTTARLTRRRYPWDDRIPVPADQWCFGRREGGMGLETFGTDFAVVPSHTHIHLPGGFKPGWIYELVYTAEAPLVLGLGHAAVRDLVSWLRHEESAANPLFHPEARIEKAYGWGRSQTGRAIRDWLYKGFNADEQGRRVFDGLLPHVAGCGRLFIGRFANLTVPAGQEYEDHDNPADRFPFSYAACTDHVTGKRDAIMTRPATDPLVMHSQTATEYWQRRGSLVHTDTEGRDLPQPDGVRIYHWCGSQHAANPLMGAPTRGVCENLENVVPTSALFRALLDALDAWATEGTPPPASRMPRRSDGTAVDFETWQAQFPAIPGIATPPRGPSDFPSWDFGPEVDAGVVAKWPPTLCPGPGYAVLIPAVDADGNELGGVRVPVVQAPLATYTGWNLRRRGFGMGALHEYTGSTIPLPEDEQMRAATGDPRPSIQARYGDAAGYVRAITAAAEALVKERLLLQEDVPRAAAAAAHWGTPRHSVEL